MISAVASYPNAEGVYDVYNNADTMCPNGDDTFVPTKLYQANLYVLEISGP